MNLLGDTMNKIIETKKLRNLPNSCYASQTSRSIHKTFKEHNRSMNNQETD